VVRSYEFDVECPCGGELRHVNEAGWSSRERIATANCVKCNTTWRIALRLTLFKAINA
jgi:hypothetical protein